jgi:hypothetical protein
MNMILSFNRRKNTKHQSFQVIISHKTNTRLLVEMFKIHIVSIQGWTYQIVFSLLLNINKMMTRENVAYRKYKILLNKSRKSKLAWLEKTPMVK